MKKRLQGLVAGLLAGITVSTCIAFAKTGTETFDAIYKDIKIYVDGVKIEPKDANGNTVEPFIYNGTTYLPVRAVGEAVDKTVTWDGKTNSVYLGKVPGEEQNLFVVCPPYDGHRYSLVLSSKGSFISMAGNKYSDAMQMGYGAVIDDPCSALFNLNGAYETLSFDVGKISGKHNATLNVYLDGSLYETFELSAEDLPRTINVSLDNALQLKLELSTSFHTYYGIANAFIE